MDLSKSVVTHTSSHDEARRKRRLFEIYREEMDIDTEILLNAEEMNDLLSYILSAPLVKLKEMENNENLPTSIVTIVRSAILQAERGVTRTTEMLFDRVYGTPEMRMKMDAQVRAEVNTIPEFKSREEAEAYFASLR